MTKITQGVTFDQIESVANTVDHFLKTHNLVGVLMIKMPDESGDHICLHGPRTRLVEMSHALTEEILLRVQCPEETT